MDKLDNILKQALNDAREQNVDLVGDSSDIIVHVSEAEALLVDSKSGAQRSPWAQEDLYYRIVLAIKLLNRFNNKVNQTNVFNLLGIDKSSLSQEREEEFKVSRLINDILQEIPLIGQDPMFPEHTVETMGSGNLGSGELILENLNNNQLLLAANLGPALAQDINSYAFKINTETPARKIMAECLWLELTKHKWFHPLQKRIRGNMYSIHLHNAIHKIAYSSRLHSTSKEYCYLIDEDREYSFSKLIKRKGSYKKGAHSYSYEFTPRLLHYLDEAVKLFTELDIECESYEMQKEDFYISKDVFREIQPRDRYIMLSQLVAIDERGYLIDNSSTIDDKQASRIYSLFSSLKSETRRALGYINYDISACMQTIVAHYIDIEPFPLHKELLEDKRRFRSKIMEELECSYATAKEHLSAADNGKQFKNLRKKSTTLDRYIDEAETLVDTFLGKVKKDCTHLYTTALSYAKYDMVIDKWEIKKGYKKKQPVFKQGDINKFSLFFFVWTQIERQIREAMMSCFSDYVHEVHDAVYSKEDIEVAIIEKAVLEKTGIAVNIEN